MPAGLLAQQRRLAQNARRGWPFDVPLPLSGAPGVECRSGGANGDHTIVVTLSNGVASGNASVTGGAGSVSGSPTFTGNKMTVNLTGVTNAQQITVQLSGVTDAVGQTLSTTTVPMDILLGDVNANQSCDRVGHRPGESAIRRQPRDGGQLPARPHSRRFNQRQ